MKLDDFARDYAEDLEGVCDCSDRMVFWCYEPHLMNGGGMRVFWRRLHDGDDSTMTTEHLADMAGDMSRRLRAYCGKHQIPVIDASKGERKCDDSKEYLPQDPKFSGLFLAICSLAEAPIWEVDRSSVSGKIINIHHPKSWRRVRYWFFHIMDRDWGHVTLRMCAHPPFTTMLILNGHEWLRRQAEKKKIDHVMDGNCFIEGSDLEKIGRLGECLLESTPDIKKLADRWLYSCLAFALPTQQQQLAEFHYEYSSFQIEYSRDYIFSRGSTLDEIYGSMTEHARTRLGLEQMKTIFGFKQRPRKAPVIQVARSRGADGVYNLTTVTLTWGGIKLKLYDKSARLLRAEVTVNNAKALHLKRQLENLPAIFARLGEILGSFMDHMQALDRVFIGPSVATEWSQPHQLGSTRIAGLNLNQARIRTVLQVLPRLSTAPDGFNVTDLVDAVHAEGRPGYNRQQARYDLRKLRGAGLIGCPPHRRKYLMKAPKARQVAGYFLLQDRLIKPLLTAMEKPPTKPRKANRMETSAAAKQLMTLRSDLSQYLDTLKFAL
jgi:hypothetical protein